MGRPVRTAAAVGGAFGRSLSHLRSIRMFFVAPRSRETATTCGEFVLLRAAVILRVFVFIFCEIVKRAHIRTYIVFFLLGGCRSGIRQ